MHDAVIPKRNYEKLARQKWDSRRDALAFRVDQAYQQEGVGSLMLAVSAVVLPEIGVRSFYTGVILEKAQRTYERFDIRFKEDFPGKDFDEHLPIERLSKHPQINKIIAEFV